MTNTGQKIRQVRKTYGLTQKSFGNLIGVSYAHVSNMESSKDFPSQSLIQVICSKFGVRYRNEMKIGTIDRKH